MVSALSTASQLSSGSPIPMNTTLVGASSGSSRITSRTWAAISAALKLRRNPIRPVAQNTQPNAHPTCDEMHSVRRLPSGISTDSTASPSPRSQRYFSVPSAERCRAESASRRSGNAAASAARSAADKAGVLRELVDLAAAGNGGPCDEVLGAILEREKQFPTGIGYGVAVPHGKTPVLGALVIVAGTTLAPVPYETIDGEPVRLFFLLVGPESAAGAHVKALSRISRLVRREPVRGKLLNARTPEEFYRVLCEAEVP